MPCGTVPDVRLVTERLVIADVEIEDLDDLLTVALSNPAFRATHEGSGGAVGAYDRQMLERDLGVADLDPARHPLTIRLRSHDGDPGDVVGWAELLDEHPRDLVPWVGLLELHADVHRRGYGRECAQAFVAWAHEAGARSLRLGVDDGNDAAATFWRSQGFCVVDRRERASPGGRLGVDVLELELG